MWKPESSELLSHYLSHSRSPRPINAPGKLLNPSPSLLSVLDSSFHSSPPPPWAQTLACLAYSFRRVFSPVSCPPGWPAALLPEFSFWNKGFARFLAYSPLVALCHSGDQSQTPEHGWKLFMTTFGFSLFFQLWLAYHTTYNTGSNLALLQLCGLCVPLLAITLPLHRNALNILTWKKKSLNGTIGEILAIDWL